MNYADMASPLRSQDLIVKADIKIDRKKFNLFESKTTENMGAEQGSPQHSYESLVNLWF